MWYYVNIGLNIYNKRLQFYIIILEHTSFYAFIIPYTAYLSIKSIKRIFNFIQDILAFRTYLPTIIPNIIVVNNKP